MTHLQKYRLLVLCLFVISLAGLGVCSYIFLKDQVPDHILVEEGEEIPAIFHFPYSSFIEEETVEAGSRGDSDIPEEQLHMEKDAGITGETMPEGEAAAELSGAENDS